MILNFGKEIQKIMLALETYKKKIRNSSQKNDIQSMP